MQKLNIFSLCIVLITPLTFAADKEPTSATEQESSSESKSDAQNIELKKIIKKKSTLKTILPFKSFCGETIKVIPPNIQLVTEFAQNTAIQSFTYDYKESEEQFNDLEKCYSKLGWQSFDSAMSQSGNMRSALDEKLFVKAKLNGEVEIIESHDIGTTWKILVPLVVRYENEKMFLEQFLKAKLVISIENKQLKVDQLIASPKLKKHKYEKPIQKFGVPETKS